jgi:hypothetical protein
MSKVQEDDQRDTMIVYRSFYESIKELPKANQAEVWEAVFELGFNFNEIELKGISLTVFRLMAPIIKKNVAQYQNGKKPKPKQSASKQQASTKPIASQIEASYKPIESQYEAYKDKEVDKDKDKEVEPLKEVSEIQEPEKPTMSPFERIKKFKSIWLSDIQAKYIYVDAFTVGQTWEKWLLTQSDEKAESTDLKYLCRSFDYFITNANNTAERIAKNRNYTPEQEAQIRGEANMFTQLNQPWD